MIITKKKIFKIAIPVIAVVLVLVILFSCNLSPKIIASDVPEVLEKNDTTGWTEVKEGIVELKNKNLTFSLNTANAHFEIKDSVTSAVYSSVAQKADTEGENQSEIIINYYDMNSTLYKMNSFKNCVKNENFQIFTSQNVVRVVYSIQKSKIILFVPKVLTEETYKKITEKLDSGERRRLRFFYTLYESDADDKITKEMKSKYPALKKQSLHILSDSAVESTYEEITSYMNLAGYTSEEYLSELSKLEIEDDSSDNMPAAFKITVEYKLNENGFTATVLRNEISSESTSFKLTDIQLLPYFSCEEQASKGWMLVPDGSGAIINLSEKSDVNYTQNIYGIDTAIEQDRSSAVIQSAGLPVFAMNTLDKAFLAIIDSAEAVASVKAEVYGQKFLQSRIFASFNCKAVDTSNAGALRSQNDLNLYAKDYVSKDYAVRYILTSGETTYSDMAGYCREYLIEKGILQENNKEYSPLYMDVTGYETIDSSFMGISVDKKIMFSDLKGINTALDTLKDSGITDVSIRLRAYSNGGIFSGVQNGLKIDSKVGSEKELKSLSERLKENGGLLYLENSISTVFNTGNGFKKMTHAARGLKKTVIKGIDYDLVAGTVAEANYTYLLTSPVYYKSLTDNFIDSFSKKVGEIANYGYSRSDFGSKLWSDFNENCQVDRCMSAHLADTAIVSAKEKFASVMTDGSNLYALKNSDVILNMPLGSSKFSCESFQIPFYQMVIHGYKDYAGSAINISQDSQTAFLQSIESGAGLYFSVYTNEKVFLKETSMGSFTYPTLFSDLSDVMIEYHKEFRELFGDLYAQTITEHICVTDKVRVTVYENGKSIAVNYGNTDAVYNGVTIPKCGYAVVGEGGIG